MPNAKYVLGIFFLKKSNFCLVVCKKGLSLSKVRNKTETNESR